MTSSHPDDGLALCPPSLHEAFRVERVLGRGGMGVVLLGRVPATGKQCAVKLLRGSAGATEKQRFLREARVMARLQHPHLLGVYDCGETDGIPWLALELVEGEDLRSLLGREGPMPPGRVREVLQQVGEALQVVHEARVLHRDVKLANIMRDRRGRHVLMDFGLARGFDQTRLTATGYLVGTPVYMAPEVLGGEEASPGSDWFSLGVALYELACGRFPFDLREVVGRLQDPEASPLPPLEFPPSLADRGLERTLRALLAPSPAARPTTLAAVCEAAAEGAGRPADDAGRSSPPRASPPGSASFAPRADRGAARRPRPWLLIGAAGVAGALLAWTQVGPGSSSGEPRAVAPPAPAEGTAPGRAAPPPDPLAGLCRDLSLSEEDPPLLTLDTALDGPDGALAARVREALGSLPEHPWARRRRFEDLGGEANLALTEAVSLDGPLGPPGLEPVPAYLEGRLRVAALEYRMHYSGPSAAGSSPERLDRLRRDLRALEETLRGDPSLTARLVRTELWSMLCRRVHRRPDFNLAALEYSLEQQLAILDGEEVLPLPVDARFTSHLAKCLAWLGEEEAAWGVNDHRWSRVLSRVRSRATRAGLEATLEEAIRAQQVGAGVLTSSFRSVHHDPTWLPFPEGYPGSLSPGEPIPRLVMEDPAPRRALVLEDAEGEDPLTALTRSGAEARGTARSLRATESWVRRHLSSSHEVSPALLEPCLRWPGIVCPAAELREQEGDLAGALALLQGALRVRRNQRPFLPERRSWFRGDEARLVLDRIRLELRAGNPADGLREARQTLGFLERLPGPWRLDELELVAGLWLVLREGLDARCRALDEEVLRVGTRVLEERARLGRAGFLGARLDRHRLVRILEEGEGGAEATAPLAGLPTPGRVLPEAVLPPVVGSYRERLAALAR